MNILIVSQSFYPDTFAINDIVRILGDRGHNVQVLTGLPDYTTSRIPEEYKHGRNRRENVYGADVIRVSTIARRHGPIWRSLNYLSFVVNGIRTARSYDWNSIDVIYVWQVSPVTMIFPAISLKKRFKKPLFVYCMDIWPECVKAMGFKEKTFFYRLIHRISKKAYHSADQIAVSSRPFIDYLSRIDDVDKHKICYLPQFASSDFLEIDLSKKPNGHFDFLYIGNIGKAQDMNCMIRAIAELKDREDVTFHFIGGGSEYENTVQLSKELGVSHIIKFYGPKPFKEAMEYYKLADASIITLDGSNRIGDTLPGKVQTYMAAGKPIIGAMNGAGKEVIQESQCGICVKAGDSKGLAKAFKEFIYHFDTDYIQCGENAKQYFKEHFTEEKHFQNLESCLNELINK